MQLQPGAVIAERFRLIRQLGRGGMGEVWAAQHISLDIPCAVKFIHAESASRPETRARFEREAKAAAQLRSPNVVQILDYGVSGEMPYIAMEYLEGEALSARLERRGRLAPAETYRIVAGIAKALQKAHQAGIVHRDLKPENVFLVPDLDGEVAKVLDFGVAKQHDTLNSNTQTGALLGTPYYMSPEQAQGVKELDHRADLWSLGVLAFRCITGELPFKSQALGDLLIKIVTHPIPVPSQLNPQSPPGFDVWYARAAERDLSRRFSSAWEMAEQLGVALGLKAGTLTPAAPAQSPGLDRTVIAGDDSYPAMPFAQSGASQADVQPSPAGFGGSYGAVPAGSVSSHSAGVTGQSGTAHAPAASMQPPAGGLGATQISTAPYAHQTHGQQMPSGSVGGVTATATPRRGGGLRLALVLASLAVVGVVAGVLVMARGDGSDADATPAVSFDEVEPDASQPDAREPEPETAPKPSTEAPADAPDETEVEDASPPGKDPSAEGEGGASAEAPPAPAPNTVAPTPRPRPRPSPKTPPKPKGYDPGF